MATFIIITPEMVCDTTVKGISNILLPNDVSIFELPEQSEIPPKIFPGLPDVQPPISILRIWH